MIVDAHNPGAFAGAGAAQNSISNRTYMSTAIPTDESCGKSGRRGQLRGMMKLVRLPASSSIEDALVSHLANEHEAAPSEQRFKAILDALPSAVYTTDAVGRITHFNPACIEFSGRTPTLGTDSWCVTWKLFNPDGSP